MRPVNLRPLWHKAKASAQVFPHDSSFRMPLQRESFCALRVHFCRIRNEELRVAIATTVFPAARSCHCHELCSVITGSKTEMMASAGISKICCDIKNLLTFTFSLPLREKWRINLQTSINPGFALAPNFVSEVIPIWFISILRSSDPAGHTDWSCLTLSDFTPFLKVTIGKRGIIKRISEQVNLISLAGFQSSRLFPAHLLHVWVFSITVQSWWIGGQQSGGEQERGEERKGDHALPFYRSISSWK